MNSDKQLRHSTVCRFMVYLQTDLNYWSTISASQNVMQRVSAFICRTITTHVTKVLVEMEIICSKYTQLPEPNYT